MSRYDESRSPMSWPAAQPSRIRVLFLDDDPDRAAIFLAQVPHAVWVATVDACLRLLEEEWDEVHLDHDLGGETFVDCGREDCGMEVVRWLCLEAHPHLTPTRFYVHSHNAGAADLMVMQLRVAGYRVEGRPFGHFPAATNYARPPVDVPSIPTRGLSHWLRELRRYVFGASRPSG
ncbi:cyclic-phosphate processing receiver domain-containing protein [Singulisphaera sp. Ch08]|uniref:Cyclic-phosphate processing receiver domain-containing protein n=1 Tax=Singulisphaera sp. Ch08 TaxID=3120278 RepID=A0AAU7CMB3_9BACT